MEKSISIKAFETELHKYRLQKDPTVKKIYYNEKTASGLETIIIHYCSFQTVLGRKIFAFKKDSMGRMIIKGQEKPIWVRNNNYSGVSDITIIINGKIIECEVKCKNTNDLFQSDAQKKFQRKVEKAGGCYWVVNDFTQFKKLIENYLLKNEIL